MSGVIVITNMATAARDILSGTIHKLTLWLDEVRRKPAMKLKLVVPDIRRRRCSVSATHRHETIRRVLGGSADRNGYLQYVSSVTIFSMLRSTFVLFLFVMAGILRKKTVKLGNSLAVAGGRATGGLPARKTMSRAMMIVSVRLAFFWVGSRKALMAFETASTPVMAVHPLAKTSQAETAT